MTLNDQLMNRFELRMLMSDIDYCLTLIDNLTNDAIQLLDLGHMAKSSFSSAIVSLESYGYPVDGTTINQFNEVFCEDDDPDTGEKKGIFARIWESIKKAARAIGRFFKRIFNIIFRRGSISETDKPSEEVEAALKEQTWTFGTSSQVLAIFTALKDILGHITGSMKIKHTEYWDELQKEANIDTPESIGKLLQKIYTTGAPLNIVKIDNPVFDDNKKRRLIKAELTWEPSIVKNAKIIGLVLPKEFNVEYGWRIFGLGGKEKKKDYADSFDFDAKTVTPNTEKPITLAEAGLRTKNDLNKFIGTLNGICSSIQGYSHAFDAMLDDVTEQIEKSIKTTQKVIELNNKLADSERVAAIKDLWETNAEYQGFVLKLLTAMGRLISGRLSDLHREISKKLEATGLLEKKEETKDDKTKS